MPHLKYYYRLNYVNKLCTESLDTFQAAVNRLRILDKRNALVGYNPAIRHNVSIFALFLTEKKQYKTYPILQ